MLVEANTALSQEKLKADMNKEIASLQAFERRELEFQQLQEKEKERAMVAQQKLRELATQELQERVQLERELATQQQNAILQTQNETDRLQAKAKQKLFQQILENAEKLAAKEKEKEKGNAPSLGTPPPEVVVAESIDSDSAPPPSQNIRRAVRRTVDHIDQLVVVQELPTTDAVCKKVKFSHTRYRVLGPELIPVYRQSARR